ncbi:MAG: ABC transporter substrate-binding protein [Oceanobacter sp.]|jgi:ABC-type transporter MlaC component
MNMLRTAFIFFAMLLGFQSAWAEEAKTPADVVHSATNELISELNKMTPEQRTDNEVRRLVMTYIVPAIDQEKIAKSALGKYWRLAKPTQRQSFIDRFRELQIRTYSGAFKAFSGEELSFEKPRLNDKGNKALVKGKLIQTNGNVIPIDFRLFQSKKDHQWRVYDAVVSGLSMVKTYREQMTERLQGTNPRNADKRMNALLDELQAEADKVAARHQSNNG